MKKKLMLATVAGLLMGMVGTAHAEGELSGGVTFTTDYLFRGITQTSEAPAIQGSLDYTNGIFYAGMWGSNIDFGGDESIELDLYGGITPTYGPLTFDLGVVGYFYPGASDDGAELDYLEAKAGVSFNLTEQFSVGGTLYYSPEFTGETGDALYSEASASYALTDTVSISGAYGHQEIDLGTDYSTWNLGVGFSLVGLDFDARYTDTDLTGLDETFTLSVGHSF